MENAGIDIRVMNENKDFGLFAPTTPGTGSTWLNLIVDDIDAFFSYAEKEGANVLSPVQEFPEIPAKNCVFADKFNNTWVINQRY